jgi:hypothetical protein
MAELGRMTLEELVGKAVGDEQGDAPPRAVALPGGRVGWRRSRGTLRRRFGGADAVGVTP